MAFAECVFVSSTLLYKSFIVKLFIDHCSKKKKKKTLVRIH